MSAELEMIEVSFGRKAAKLKRFHNNNISWIRPLNVITFFDHKSEDVEERRTNDAKCKREQRRFCNHQ